MALRSDAARNRAAIIDAATRAFRRDGAAASLEEIARTAGVGSATLHRHFHGRQALLDAVFLDDVQTLCAEAPRIAARAAPPDALWLWLEHIAVHCAADDALSTLIRDGGASAGSRTRSGALLAAAGQRLLDGAVAAGSVRADLSVSELLVLANAIAAAAATGAADVPKLLSLVRHGAAHPT
jgi:AcrR family transcriptional regulator